jgi:predicted phage baseplate assembly protein
VARAKAIPGYHPGLDREMPGIVTVIVVQGPAEPKLSDTAFLEAVYKHLEQHRLLTTRLFVTLPRDIEVSVKAEVVIKPEYVTTNVEERVKTELEQFLAPLTGGKNKKGWPFGRAVYKSEILKVIDGVEGVDFVKTGTPGLKKTGAGEDWQDIDITIPPHCLIDSGTHDIKAVEPGGG